MKINKENNFESTDIGDLDEIKSTIADENLGLALTMMSKNLYSDPIGSFIREITSNAVDANVDANADSPVMIHVYIEEDSYYIEFKDNGVGMSPETFQNIYMSWFNSDKRDTNDKIGGWGLGSKSPLAYQDYFEIITRFNGVKYHYIMSNQNTEPKADLILDESTDEGNGTTIRIELKDSDMYQISIDLEKQLAYFNTVYVKNDYSYYNNNFKIYEKGLWKLRNISQPFHTMHICLGQVAYPINWEVLDLTPINIPVALNFNVGDLAVTVSREEINYTKEVREILLERIEIVKEELLDIYSKQANITDLFEYFKEISNRDKPPLKIEDVELSMKGFKQRITFEPFPAIKVSREHCYLLFGNYDLYQITNGKANLISISSLRYRNLKEIHLIRGRLNFYDTAYIENGYILRKAKWTKGRFQAYAELLNNITIENKYTFKKLAKLGTYKDILDVSRYIHNYLDENLKAYDNICPEWYKEEHRAEQREANQKRKEKITFYNHLDNRFSMSIQEVIDSKAVFYLDKKEDFSIKLNYMQLYGCLNEYFQNRTHLIIINPTTIKRIAKYNNVFHASNIFKVKSLQNHFFKYIMTNTITNTIKPLKGVFNYSNYYHELYHELYNKFKIDIEQTGTDKEYNRIPINLYEAFQEELKVVKPTKDYEYYFQIQKELLEVISKLEILHFLKIGTPEYIISKLIKGKGITKMNEEYYKDKSII